MEIKKIADLPMQGAQTENTNILIEESGAAKRIPAEKLVPKVELPEDLLKYSAQELTEEQKVQVRENIGAVGMPATPSAYQHLVTDANGNAKWADQIAYAESNAVTLIKEQTISTVDGAWYCQSGVEFGAFEEGRTYTVFWNDDEYTLGTQYCAYWDALAVGNPSLCGEQGAEDNGLPFHIVSYGDGSYEIFSKVEGEYKVKMMGESVRILDEKFLPFKIRAGEGENSLVFNDTLSSVAKGEYSHAEGYQSCAYGFASHAEGGSEAYSERAHAEGNSKAFGTYAHAEGSAWASGNSCHGEGGSLVAAGNSSHAEGGVSGHFFFKITGDANAKEYSVIGTTPTTFSNEIVGRIICYADEDNKCANALVTGCDSNSKTITVNTTLSKKAIVEKDVFAFGSGVLGAYSHSEGNGVIVCANNAHGEGLGVRVSSDNQHVQGRYNIEDAEGKYAHIVGNGSVNSSTKARQPSNAHTLDWDGNAWFAGTMEGTGVIVKSSTSGSSKRFKITVDDTGAITATEVTG